jgi:hypothetical protein
MVNLAGAWIEADVTTNERGTHSSGLFNLDTGTFITRKKDGGVDVDTHGIRRVVSLSYDDIKTRLKSHGLLLDSSSPQPL